jgi:hypothetical protein
MRNRYLYITLLSVLALHAEAQRQAGARQVPRLVVNISIDQLRSDCMDVFAPTFSEDGFQKLLTEGMVFERAYYPFQEIDRASAISSVITGTTPFYHGITGEQWIDRKTLKRVYCTEDPQRNGIPSPVQLAVSTLGDELKAGTEGKGKVFGIATTGDAAVLSAGHAADGAFWADLQERRWRGSSYYPISSPAWLQQFNSSNKPSRRNRKKQDPWTARLNTNVTEMALLCITNEMLGQDSIPDLLCLSYDAGSQEQDSYQQIDSELGSLVSQIEKQVGSGQTLYVVSSTGYHKAEAVDAERYRIPTGTFYINRTANLLNLYFGAIWGQGHYVEACFKNQLYLNHQLLESKRVSLADATERAREFILQMAGVKKVTTTLYEQHRGDLTIEVSPGWHIQNEDTHEDQLVQLGYHPFPIIVFGANLPAKRIQEPVSVDRIAPAIAHAIRIRAPNACSSEPLF